MLVQKNAHQRTYDVVLLRSRLPNPSTASCGAGPQLKQDRLHWMEMEEFEYSVEICDRDWECFFAECEECNLLPPSLAGVDDSGMSDIDDTGSILAKRVQKVDQTAGFSEADHPIDGPPDCEGSPVEHYLSRHGVSGMESVLSGSEEDIHLQCVNIFFERLKKVTGAERLTEPSQASAVKTREIQEEARCSDGKQASSTSLPKNIPELNSLPARGEPAVGKETTEPVDTIGNIMKKEEPGFNMSPEPAACNSVLKINKSAHPEAKALIIEEACTETRWNDVTTQIQSHDSPDGVETRPHTDKVIKVEMCTPLDNVKQEDWLASQVTLGKKCSTESSWSNLEMGTNIKRKEDPNVSQSDAISTNITASQESSPSASVRRKRRKKRRLSTEPAESVHGYERQDLIKPSDSEEERFAWRGGMAVCVSKDFDLFPLNEPQQNVLTSLTTYSTISNLPVKVSAKEINVNDLPLYSPPSGSQYQNLPERIVRQGRHKAAAENNAANERSVTPLSQTEDSGDVAANLQPCRKLQVDESPGLSNLSGLPVSFTDGVTGKSDPDTETVKFREDAHALSLRLSDKVNRSCAAEVKPLTRSVSSSAESNDPAVEGSQIDKLSAAKSVLAEDAGNSGRDKHTLCQREAEHRQQLEIDCHYTDQYSSPLEKTRFPLPADGLSSSDAHNTKPKQLKTRACPVLEEISTQVDSAELTLDTSNSLPDKCCLSKSPSSLDGNVRLQQTEDPLVLHTLSKCDVFSEKNATTERAELAGSQIMAFNGNPFISGEITLTGKSQRETKTSTSEDVPTSPSDITPLSSCCTLDTESGMSLSGSSCLSVSQNDSELQGEKTLILAEHKEADGTSGTRSQAVSNDATPSTCDLVLEAEDVVAVCKAGCEPEPDSKCSVFTMSSFWSEMEKLTINDILGLRMISGAAPPSSLPPLQESEEADVLAMTDSGVFTHLDESKPEQTTSSVESSSGSSRDVMWESEPVPVSLGADIYTENMMLTPGSDISEPVLAGGSQTRFRKICKNVSVHNLHALESFSYTWKGQTLQTLDEGELEKVEYFPDGHMLKPDKDMDCAASSSTDGYRISLTDIFQYLFGGKQSNPSQPAADDITICYADGNSVPETYDQFFSEFDTESFFCPLITAEDQAKGELVPVFSCSRSANRNLQFPEAYDYFFASLSSDDSSVESDEEDNCGPVRVVNRFNRTSSASKISTDIYENFFTDSDLRQNLFWNNTLSFRNISLSPSTVRKQTLSNPLAPVSQSGRSFRRTVHPLNALGNQDVVFSDPLLHHLEDRISRQLAQQPFIYEDLQTAVSNPRLDASFLPLRQSDMCLVCIAFASWVLKTANPQVGDAWKAVLLANVSALSAIRYLRKYVKMEAAASERKLHLTAPSDS